MPTFTQPLPPTRTTGGTSSADPAVDVNALTAALTEVRAAGLVDAAEADAAYSPRLPGLVWISGRYYGAAPTSAGLTTWAVNADRLYLIPMRVAAARPVDQIGIQVTTAAAGTLRMGVYASDPVTGLPTTVIADGGAPVDSGTIGPKTQTISTTVDRLVWLAVTCTAAATVQAYGQSSMDPVAGATALTAPPACYAYTSHPAGTALPDLTNAALTYAATNCPAVMLRSV